MQRLIMFLFRRLAVDVIEATTGQIILEFFNPTNKKGKKKLNKRLALFGFHVRRNPRRTRHAYIPDAVAQAMRAGERHSL